MREKEEEKARATPTTAVVVARAHRMQQPRSFDPSREPRAPLATTGAQGGGAPREGGGEARREGRRRGDHAARGDAAARSQRRDQAPRVGGRWSEAHEDRRRQAAAARRAVGARPPEPGCAPTPTEPRARLRARARTARAPTVVRVTAHRHRRREPRVSAPSRPCRHRLVQSAIRRRLTVPLDPRCLVVRPPPGVGDGDAVPTPRQCGADPRRGCDCNRD